MQLSKIMGRGAHVFALCLLNYFDVGGVALGNIPYLLLPTQVLKVGRCQCPTLENRDALVC